MTKRGTEGPHREGQKDDKERNIRTTQGRTKR